MPDDFWSAFRPSANVQQQRPDALRTLWLDEAANAPDGYRAQAGHAALTPRTRGAVLGQYTAEQPFVPTERDWFGMGTLPRVEDYSGSMSPFTPPAPRGFLQHNDDAVLADQVGSLLSGHGAPANARSASAPQSMRSGAGSNGTDWFGQRSFTSVLGEPVSTAASSAARSDNPFQAVRYDQTPSPAPLSPLGQLGAVYGFYPRDGRPW